MRGRAEKYIITTRSERWKVLLLAPSVCVFLRLRGIVMSMAVCLSVCMSVREDISGTTRAIFTIFVRVSYVRGSVLLRQLTIGHIAYQREEGDGNVQRVRSVIYDFLVCV